MPKSKLLLKPPKTKAKFPACIPPSAMTVTVWTLRVVFLIWLPISVDKKIMTEKSHLDSAWKNCVWGPLQKFFFSRNSEDQGLSWQEELNRLYHSKDILPAIFHKFCLIHFEYFDSTIIAESVTHNMLHRKFCVVVLNAGFIFKCKTPKF